MATMTTPPNAFDSGENDAGCWDDGVPFFPDKLCQHCTYIFEKPGKYNTNILYIHPTHLPECRLCTLLAQHFTKYLDDPSERMQVGYFISNRSHSPGLYDLMFRLCGVYYGTARDLRFGIQMRNGPDMEFCDRMVPFRHSLSTGTGSEDAFLQAKNWLAECVQTHDGCRSISNQSKFVPSRLIEISGVDDERLEARLVEGKDVPAIFSYATLSHCWGETMPFKLTLDNLTECFDRLILSKLSRVFQEALKFTWRMKIYYLWIDSLCIIQDSHEDWVAESSRMGSIYRGGILNLAAATGCKDTARGLLTKRDARLITPITVSVPSVAFLSFDPRYEQKRLERGDYYLVDMLTWVYGVDQSPLCDRGWVAQERAMSVRTIYFGAQQLYWDCAGQGNKATEVYPQGLLRGTLFFSPKYVLRSGLGAAYRRTEAFQRICDIVQVSGSRIPVQNEHEDTHTGKQKNLKRGKKLRLELDPWIELCGSWSDGSEESAVRKNTAGALRLIPAHLEGCDLDALDGLGLENWAAMKSALQEWGIGAHIGRPTARVSTEVRQWMQIVEYYSRCSLTFSHDKLVAISGIAELFDNTMGCAYLSGLWERDLRHQLLWKTWPRCAAPVNGGTRGPSWSWTAIDSQIHFTSRKSHLTDTDSCDIQWLAHVDDASVQLATDQRFGQVRSGTITVTGRLGVFGIHELVPLDQINTTNLWATLGNGETVLTLFDTAESKAKFNPDNRRMYLAFRTFGSDEESMTDLRVFVLPIRVSQGRKQEHDPWYHFLEGLLLVPTGEARGQYYRVGHVEYDHNMIPEAWPYHCLTMSTDIVDQKYFIAREGDGPETKYTITIV